MNNINPWYITGFLEASGSFTYTNGCPVIAARFRRTERELADLLVSFFIVGTVYETKNGTYYRVARLNELYPITQHLDACPFLSQRRLAVYKAWKDLIQFKHEMRLIGRVRASSRTASLAEFVRRLSVCSDCDHPAA